MPIAEAFRLSKAGALAPFQYLEIIGATAAGYLVFGDFPDAITWIGITIILASGFYVFTKRKKPINTALYLQKRAGRSQDNLRNLPSGKF